MSAVRRLPGRFRGAASRSWLYYTLIAGLSVVYYLSFYNYSLNLTDEGFLVNGALRVLEGQVPVSGFYSYAPGRYYLLAALFATLGVNIATERLMWLPLMVIRNLLVFSVCRRLLHPWVSLVVALTVLLVPGPWYKTFCSLLMFAQLELLFRFVDRPSTRGALLLGTLTGAFLYFRQDFFVYGVIICLVAIPASHIFAVSLRSIAASSAALRKRLMLSVKHYSLMLAASVASALPMLLFYGARGELAILLRRMGPSGLATTSVVSEARQFPDLALLAYHLSRLPNHWPQRFNIWFADVWFSYLALFVLILCATLVAHRLVRWARGRLPNGKQTVLLVALLAWSAATAVRLIELPLFTAFLEVSSGILALMAFLLSSLWAFVCDIRTGGENLRPLANLLLQGATRLVTVLLVGGVLGFSWLNLLLYGLRCDTCGTIGARQPDAVPLQVERAEVLLPPDQASELSALIDEVRARTSADEGIFAFRRPMLYFLTERRNPSRMDWPLSPVADPWESAELTSALREHPPTIEIVHANSWLVHIISRYSCDLQHTLFDDYDIVALHGDYIVLERTPGSDGWSLLRDELASRGLSLTRAPDCEP